MPTFKERKRQAALVRRKLAASRAFFRAVASRYLVGRASEDELDSAFDSWGQAINELRKFAGRDNSTRFLRRGTPT